MLRNNSSFRSSLYGVAVVAWHELLDSIKSRRAIVLLLLYLAGSVAGCAIFIKVLHTVENGVEKTIGVSESKKAGATTSVVWKSEVFKQSIIHLTGDRKELVDYLLTFPPLCLYYGWLSFTFAPFLVVMLSSSRISEEVWSGSVRFVAFRTSRLGWCFGKYAGQALQLLLALLISAVGAWLTGYFKLANFDGYSHAAMLLMFALKAWIYCLAFLGLATGISQLISSPNIAMATGIIMLMVFSILSGLASHLSGDGWRKIWDIIDMLLPGGHDLDMFYTDLRHMLPAIVYLVSLSFLYVMAGYARFGRRDL